MWVKGVWVQFEKWSSSQDCCQQAFNMECIGETIKESDAKNGGGRNWHGVACQQQAQNQGGWQQGVSKARCCILNGASSSSHSNNQSQLFALSNWTRLKKV